MRLTTLILITALLQVRASTYAQKITLHENNAALEKVFDKIRIQTGFDFITTGDVFKNSKPVKIEVKNAGLEEVLKTIFATQPLSFKLQGKIVVVSSKTPLQDDRRLNAAIIIEGKIVNEKGEPIVGASIKLKSGKEAFASGAGGTFSIPDSYDGQVIVISYIGYKAQEVKVSVSRKNWIIKLEVDEKKLDEVLVTGIVNRQKATFTGATATFTATDLKAVGNTNIISSLRTLDPSFLIMENNFGGSNPNTLPTIELRGQTSISAESLRDEFSSDPNQPLFILDGFETSLRNIVDLDMNRIASITILKDAASTAIYGSRASNGVIVVETVKPKPGQVILNYTSDNTFEFPDISSYNLMDAREKLEFERLSLRYTASNDYDPELQDSRLTPLYAARLKEVERGVNSYWLSEPLQTGVSNRHSLAVTGGTESLMFAVAGNYKAQQGVMKGSGRNEWGGRINLTYRNNKVNINNNLYISGYDADESPYGQFSTWVNVNPYYRKLPASEPYLETAVNYTKIVNGAFEQFYVSNPIFNANLTSFNKTKNYTITNNLQLTYDINNILRFQTGAQISKGKTDVSQFVSPLDTRFRQTDALRKGTYGNKNQEGFSYTTNAMLTYGQNFGKHILNANLRAELSETNNNSKGFSAEGFPSASNGNPRFAYGYTKDGRPSSLNSISRRNSVLFSANYSYDMRYNFDGSVTYDGTTAFGQENLYSPFYSVGASWNINREKFMEDYTWIDNLRIRGNIGITGNQNFSSTTSVTTYNYLPIYNLSGQGVEVATLGNANLEWQNTLQTSLGLDAALWNNRLSLYVNAYRKVTDPLVVAITLPSSTALSNYPFNAGSLTVSGLELNLRYAPIYRPKDRFTWFIGLTGSTYTQKYDKFDNKLASLNEALKQSNSLVRYRDGADAGDLWAVPSLGIDPATGKELFLKKDGTKTFDFSYDDQVVVGNSRPKYQGVLSTNLTYKGFLFNASFRYLIDQDVWNSALYEKVENISMSDVINNNQDKRALYERWQQPGDIAAFKSISVTTTTPISSRFVQNENAISFESINVGYQFSNSAWMKKLSLANLRVNAYTNDVFRISTVRRERGISYPYARSFSFSVSANFQ
jgi:TonB-linked SusC/RagA family outer membrane protein